MDGFGVGRRAADGIETQAANRTWWDDEAIAYYAEHGDFLRDDQLVWGPEGLNESELGLLGPLTGRDVLEIGAGAAQGARFVASQGARVVATDLSAGMLRQAAAIDAKANTTLPLAQCDAIALPFAAASFDVVFTAYGAVPFVADSAAIMREAARVLRPGGRFVFSTTHPIRWAFPDAPGPEGLVADRSYFDRTPYVEEGDDGTATYVEHHRTLGDRIRELAAAGLVLVDLVEPEWPDRNAQVWGGWSPTRGRVLPGTAIFVARAPKDGSLGE
jgi:SAM-dependent methyltransferase